MSREIRSPVYQIDFTAVDAGKRIASTKRRIRWYVPSLSRSLKLPMVLNRIFQRFIFTLLSLMHIHRSHDFDYLILSLYIGDLDLPIKMRWQPVKREPRVVEKNTTLPSFGLSLRGNVSCLPTDKKCTILVIALKCLTSLGRCAEITFLRSSLMPPHH